MKNAFAVTALVVFLSVSARAEDDWKKELAGPLVTISAGKMVFQEFELCTVTTDESNSESVTVQVRTRSEAPSGTFISRDYFVALTAVISASFTSELGDDNCKLLDSPIGDPELTIDIKMAKEGLQVASADARTGQKASVTTRWQELFED